MLDISSYFFEGEYDDLFSFSDGPQSSGDEVNTLQNAPVNSLQNTQMNTLQNVAPTNTLQNASTNTLQNTPNNSLQSAPANTLQNTSNSGNTLQNSQNTNSIQQSSNTPSRPLAPSAPQKNFRSAWEYDGHDKNSYAYTPQNSNTMNLPKGNFTSPSSLGGREIYSPRAMTPR